MKITTYIDEKLLQRALRVSRARSKREVLEDGLRLLLEEIQRHTFVREFNRFRLRLTPEELEEIRR